MGYEYILFDLDGTITDPALGITNSIIYALEKYNIKVTDRSDLYKCIGPPLHSSFEKFYGFSNEEARVAVEYYREYFKEKGIFENKIYDGFLDLLKLLKENGKTLIIATSKPEVFARQIVQYFNIDQYFTYIAGSSLDGTRSKKSEVISYALESCNIKDLSKTVMIGDREHDIIGAKEVGIESIGVLFGYGDRNELQKAGADFIASNVDEVGNIVLERNFEQA